MNALAAHLERCAECRRVLKREQRTAELLGALRGVEPRADAWPAVESAIRSAARARRRPVWWQPMLWAGGLAAAAALSVSLVVPDIQVSGARYESDSLRALAPRAAAGLVPDRSRDPLMTLETKLDRALDSLAVEGS